MLMFDPIKPSESTCSRYNILRGMGCLTAFFTIRKCKEVYEGIDLYSNTLVATAPDEFLFKEHSYRYERKEEYAYLMVVLEKDDEIYFTQNLAPQDIEYTLDGYHELKGCTFIFFKMPKKEGTLLYIWDKKRSETYAVTKGITYISDINVRDITFRSTSK